MAKVHLGIICGNEEAMIGRFLDSFLPHVDSLSVVRAIGNQEPDKTLEIAKQRGCLVGEYRNAEGHEWPHVDDFAAARNQSFAMAPEGTDFLMWADCDDLLSETAAKVLRLLRDGRDPGADVIYAPYVTNASGSYARRVRLIKTSAYDKWINAVHEDIEHKEGSKLIWSNELQVIHMPVNNKRGSVARNRRILEAIPEDKRTGREWWFLFRECEIQQDIPKAMEAAIVATAREDLGDEEKFVAYQTIGRWIKNLEDAERPLLEAVRLMPHRREGYAELAKVHLARGSAAKALAYLNAMEGQPEPSDPSWTHDASLFGWRAHDLKAVALSKAGHGKESDNLRREYRKRHRPRIAVGHPTCRPEQAIKIRELYLERAARPELVSYFFGVNEGDAAVVEGIKDYPHAVSAAVPKGNSSAVANYNAAAKAAAESSKIVLMAQDDCYPPHGWDEQIVQAMEPHKGKPTVLHVFDGFRKDQIMVLPCFNWSYFAGRKWLFNPEFDGYWSDTEWSWRAYKEGVVKDGRHIQFFHDHPLFTGAKSDAEYMRQQNPEAERRGREVFERVAPDAVAAGW
jgi:glycosyltransferase involved in cell wall biosynthesis